MPKQKVLYVITKSNFYGAQRYVFDLATNINKVESNSTVELDSTWEPVVALGGNGPLVQALADKGVRTIPIKGLERDINLWKEAGVLWQVFKIIVRERPHVVHVNSSKTGGLGAVAARVYRWCVRILFPFSRREFPAPKIIYTVHGWPFNETRFTAPLARQLLYFFSWLTCVFATDVIVIAKNELAQAYALPLIPKRKFHLVHNGTAPFEMLARPAAQAYLATRFAEQADFLHDKLVIGAVGELHQVKGLDFLIAALRKLKEKDVLTNVACVLVGNGDLETELKAKAEEAGLGEVVFFPGFVLDAKQYLLAFDIFVMPSRKEGLPYAIMEAGLASLPVVASNVFGIPDMLTHTGILVGVGDVDALTQALERLITSSDERSHLGHALHEKISADFSLDQMLKKTLAVYRAQEQPSLL